jgi:hypothetical protein
MKKLDNLFLIGLISGFVAFSATLAIPTQMGEALIKTNLIENNTIASSKIKNAEVNTSDIEYSAISKEKLAPSLGVVSKLVIEFRRGPLVTVQPGQFAVSNAICNPDEIVVSGGYVQTLVHKGFAVASEFIVLPQEYDVIAENRGIEWTEFQVFANCAHFD